MKKKKKGNLSNLLMLVLLLILFYYFFTEIRSTEVSAAELARIYSTDLQTADKKFLNQEIELVGKVKAYFEFENDNDLLEIISENSVVSVFCILIDNEQINKAKNLTQGTEIEIKGKCLGLAENIFPNSVYINVNSIK
ncbi:MAG: OB-fold putative lipoprotein [Ignavibacteria bacterium]|nr:OB-fold putative lipoprotein [Ignavibacteria bacterium]